MDATLFSDAELAAYLDETLSAERSAEIERRLRAAPELRDRLAALVRRRDQGGHTVGEIWRRRRLSCLTRAQLGSFLLGVAPPGLEDYIQFHLQTIGCRLCQANLADLQASQEQSSADAAQRHRKYFESSAGLLRSQRPD